jgi:cysteine desulfurase
MEPYLSKEFYNPSATYLAARKIRRDLSEARGKIAMWLGSRPANIYYTAGATEANNLAIQGVMRRFPDGELLVSAIEHESVLAPAGMFKHRLIPVNDGGRIILNKLSNLITDKTVLISVMMVNNELGTIQAIKDIAALLRDVRLARKQAHNDMPVYLHTDAAQAGNLFDLHSHRLGVDMMSVNGGKIYGPKQTGALLIGPDVEIKPIIVGGGQEGNIRSGTENVAGAIGLSKALDLTQKRHAAEFKRLSELRNIFVNQLAAKIPDATINGSPKHNSPHLLSVTFPGFDNERLMMELDEAGIQCAAGSACSASRDEPSHVLSAIGLDEKAIRSTLRFSLGRQTTRQDIEETVAKLAALTDNNR